MNEIEIDKRKNSENSEKQGEERRAPAKRVRKTQGQIIQEALGLNPPDIQDVEKKLFIVRFLDYFSEETLDFAFKDRTLNQYFEQITSHIKAFSIGREEDRLLEQSFESKKILNIINKLKEKAEELAKSKGVKGSIDKRLRKLSLLAMLPLLVVIILMVSIIQVATVILFPILCISCMLPQLIKGKVVKKWFEFKEQNKHQIYSENREDIMILKNFAGEILDNIRSRLLELNVPLQLIKFVLHSQDYENLHLINQKNIKGTMQYFYTFEYPQGVQPVPIPEELERFNQPLFSKKKKTDKLEKNFVVLTEMKGKDGIISDFVPTLKDKLAEKINDMLNNSEFIKASNDSETIIPSYSENRAIYCLCGEVVEIRNVQICNWKDQFKYYLFEGKECKCGESVYALSLMDESIEIPEELKGIFSS